MNQDRAKPGDIIKITMRGEFCGSTAQVRECPQRFRGGPLEDEAWIDVPSGYVYLMPECYEILHVQEDNPTTVNMMFEAAIEAVEHVGQANWSGREQAAISWLKRVLKGKTDKSLEDIQEEINEE